MLIKTRIYLVAVLLIIIAAVALIYTLKNKNSSVCKYLIFISALGIAYLFIDLAILAEFLGVGAGLELLLLYLAGLVGGIIYAIAIVLNIRRSAPQANGMSSSPVPGIIRILTLVFILFPIIFISVRVIRDRILISGSDALVVFDSRGNGGFGDGDTFAYALKGEKCRRFDLHIDYGLNKLVPKDSVKVTPSWDRTELGPYTIIIESSDISIMYEGNEIYSYDSSTGPYFNIDIDECYHTAK